MNNTSTEEPTDYSQNLGWVKTINNNQKLLSYFRAPVQKAKKTVTIKSTTKKKTPPKVASAAKTKKKWRVAFDENQAQIDAGQKKFGTTECNDCGLLYQQVNICKFFNWKSLFPCIDL